MTGDFSLLHGRKCFSRVVARLRAQDARGKTFEREESGLAARCFLHETDHCDGKLFIHRLSPLRRDLVLRKFRKLKKAR